MMLLLDGMSMVDGRRGGLSYGYTFVYFLVGDVMLFACVENLPFSGW